MALELYPNVRPEYMGLVTALEQSLSRESFFDFVKLFWDTVIPESPVWNWHIEALCDELQEVAERVFRGEPKEYDLLINVPPGSTKSTIVSRMFPAWLWTRMPSAKCICGSYGFHLALSLSRDCRDVIQSDLYRRLFGDIELREDQNAKGFYVNKAGGFRLAIGAGGSAGFHAHFLIIDDPLDPNEVVSEAGLKSAKDWFKYLALTRKVDKKVTPTILVMQRLHQDDPAGMWLDLYKQGKMKLRHICLPAEIDSPDDRARVRPRAWARRYQDGLLDPVRLDREVLKDFQEGETGGNAFMYAAQMQQSPIPAGGGMFKIDKVEIVDSAPSKMMWVRYWDKAASQNKGCYTVGSLVGIPYGGPLPSRDIYVGDVVRGQWSSEAREAVIKQTAKLDGDKVKIGLEVEGGSGGLDSARATVRNLMGFVVIQDKPTGDKVLRADPLATQFNSGNVKLVRGAWNSEFLKEFQYFPHSKYKDQVDATSGAFSLLTKPLRLGAIR